MSNQWLNEESQKKYLPKAITEHMNEMPHLEGTLCIIFEHTALYETANSASKKQSINAPPTLVIIADIAASIQITIDV